MGIVDARLDEGVEPERPAWVEEPAIGADFREAVQVVDRGLRQRRPGPPAEVPWKVTLSSNWIQRKPASRSTLGVIASLQLDSKLYSREV